MSKNLTPINVDYLKEIQKISGKTIGGFCESIGRSESTYYNAISRGACQDVILRMIANIYKCDYNKLVLPAPEPVQPWLAETPEVPEQAGSREKDIEYIKQMAYCIMVSNDRIAKAVQDLNGLMTDFLK